MTTIDTSEDWWDVLNKNWTNILEIASRVGCPFGSLYIDKQMGLDTGLEIVAVHIQRLKQTRNAALLLHWLNAFWAAAPDRPYIHTWPGWAALCDLCSESEVVLDELDQ